MQNGWIKIYRKMMDKGFYKNSKYVHLWVHLLLEATHKPKEVLWNGKTFILQPGQFITGRKKLAGKTKINQNSVERILNYFKNEHQIEQQTTNKNRLITILKWERYQGNEQLNEQQVSNKRATSEQQVSTNKKEDKNVKNEKKKNKELFVGNQNHFRLTNLLKDLMLQNDPKAKIPKDITKWVDPIEKLERIDKRTAGEIEAVIRFSQEDDFWKANILSTEKLRKQFPQLMLKAKQNFGGLSGKMRRSLQAIMEVPLEGGDDES